MGAGAVRPEEGAEGVVREGGVEVGEAEVAVRTLEATARMTMVVTMEVAARVVRPEEGALGALDARPQWRGNLLGEDVVGGAGGQRLRPLPLR